MANAAAANSDTRNRIWRGAAPWQPIKALPFEEFSANRSSENFVIVTDGEKIAVCYVRDRTPHYPGEGPWVLIPADDEDHDELYFKPSKWMPMPPV
jgi:hypothetical protein